MGLWWADKQGRVPDETGGVRWLKARQGRPDGLELTRRKRGKAKRESEGEG